MRLKPADSTTVTLGFLYQKDEDGLPAFHDLNLPNYQTGRIYQASSAYQTRLFSLTVQQDFDWLSLTSAWSTTTCRNR